MKISKGAPHSAPWREIAKTGTKRLCAPMFSITLQSFNFAKFKVGHVIREDIEKTELLTDERTGGRMYGQTDGRTPDPFYRVISET